MYQPEDAAKKESAIEQTLYCVHTLRASPPTAVVTGAYSSLARRGRLGDNAVTGIAWDLKTGNLKSLPVMPVRGHLGKMTDGPAVLVRVEERQAGVAPRRYSA